MIYVSIVQTTNDHKPSGPSDLENLAATTGPHSYWLVAGDDKMVIGFKTKAEGLAYYEKGYRAGHQRSYEGSMSACINWMFFRPSIVRTTEETLNEICKKAPDGRIMMSGLSHVSGFMRGIQLMEKEAEILWKKGTKPSLA